MSVGYANGIRVMSMTHTGEPGFMLYIPIEVCGHPRACAFIIRETFVQHVDGVTPLSSVCSTRVQ